MATPNLLMAGKKGLIMGLANDKSIAWGIAQALNAQGAQIAISYQNEALEKRVVPLAEQLEGETPLIKCDVTSSESMEQCFKELGKKWGKIDFLVHAIAFSDRNELKGRTIDTTLPNFLNTMHISCYSFLEACRCASPIMNEGGSIVAMTYLGAEKLIPNYNIMGVAKAALDAMKSVIDGTNVYTAEAFETYNAVYTAKNEAYEAGILTSEEANAIENPEKVTGWRAATIVDDFLLSAWDTNPDFNNAPYYINTWSVEGESDGSEFKVPFFEYWTGDGNSLGEKVLTAKIEDVKPDGIYDVTALVRVRVKNNVSDAPTGITLTVNDGEAVDVTAGDQIGTSQFYMKEFVANGTVDADGILTVKFNVAADNNISWLSFKNIFYSYNEELSTGISSINAQLNSEAIYNLQGQKLQKTVKGLNIIGGKKIFVK